MSFYQRANIATIGDLIDFLTQLDNREGEVWIGNTDGRTSNMARSIYLLNYRRHDVGDYDTGKDTYDVILESEYYE